MITIDSWTTPGVGDFMMVLNRIHWLRRTVKRDPWTVNFHWYHDKDHHHHFEDPETIIQRLEYISRFYKHHRNIQINSICDSTDEQLKRERIRYHGIFNPGRHYYDNMWSFRQNTWLPEDRNKVVIWRPLFNAETARDWKQVVTNQMWDDAIDILQNQHGYKVVELTYRTPIREATYHINTCHFVVCYDGMWHYIAKNFFKPMIVTSRSPITKYHTPHAVMWHDLDNDKNLIFHLKNLHTPLSAWLFENNGKPGKTPEDNYLTPYQVMMDKCITYKKYFKDCYSQCRLIER